MDIAKKVNRKNFLKFEIFTSQEQKKDLRKVENVTTAFQVFFVIISRF